MSGDPEKTDGSEAQGPGDGKSQDASAPDFSEEERAIEKG